MRIGMRIYTPPVQDASLHYKNGDLAHTIESVAKLGYDSVEIDVKHPREINVQEIRRLLNDNGLDWCGIGTGRMYVEDGLSFTDPDPGKRKEAVGRMCSLIELGAEFGAIPMIGLARYGREGVREPQTSHQLMMEGLYVCAETARKCGHIAMVENITRYLTPALNTVAETMAVLDEIDSPHLQFMYDTYHAHLEERSMFGSLVAGARRLCYVHMSDGNREAPGWGLVDFSEVVGVLAALNYRGPIVCEVLMTPDHQRVAEHSIQFLQSLLDKHGVQRVKSGRIPPKTSGDPVASAPTQQ